jgi:hypothetical protein
MNRNYRRIDGVLEDDAGGKLHRSDNIVIRTRLGNVRRVATNGPLFIVSLLDGTDRETVETAHVVGELDPEHNLTIVDADGTGITWRHPVRVSFNGRGSPEFKTAGQLFCFSGERGGPVDDVSIGFHLPPERFEWLWKKLAEFREPQLNLTFRMSGSQEAVHRYNIGEVDFPAFVIDQTEPHPIHVVEIEVVEPARPEPVKVENEKGELVPPVAYSLNPKVVRYLGWTVALLAALLIATMAKP